MESLTSAVSSRRGWVLHGVLLAAVLLGPANLARLISGVTSLITWPITRDLRFADNRYEIFNAELLMIYLVAVLGLNVIMRVGLVSIGHSAFFGLGAYFTAIATVDWDWSFFVALPMAGLVCGIVGLLLGAPALRLGLYAFTMVTVGYAFIAPEMAMEWRGLTGGGDGLRGVKLPSPFTTLEDYYWVIAFVLVVGYVVVHNLLRSPFGRAGKALDENEVAAQSLGISPHRTKLVAFAISTAFAGVAGALYVPVLGFIAPDSFTVQLAILFLLMVLLGGAGTVGGPIVGAVLLFRIPLEIERVTTQPGDWSLLVYGVMLLLSVFLFPKGLMSGWWLLRSRLFGRFRAPAETKERTRAKIGGRLEPVQVLGEVLAVEGVAKNLAGVRALSCLDLKVEAGMVHALIGPNGSGKTTFLNVVSGFLSPDEGTIRLLGNPEPGTVSQRAAQGLGRTFQTPLMFDDMTCAENVLVALDNHRDHGHLRHLLRTPGARAEERERYRAALDILDSLGLGDRATSPASSLPPGERRLLEIARVLALQPRLVLMDEPAAGLTSGEIDELEEVIRALRDAGIAVLLVEHHVDFVMRLADTVTVIDFGEVIAHGKPDVIRNDPRVITAYLGTDPGASADLIGVGQEPGDE